MQQLERTILAEISKPTDRGQQISIGPSEIGGCPLCIGETLALRLPDQYPELAHEENFGVGSWIGTAVHDYLEREVGLPGAIKEQKNVIYELEGYGTIKGSTDVFFTSGRVVDWKVVGEWSYNKMRLAYLDKPNRIPTTQYRVQQHCYGYGWAKAGYDVQSVSLCVIPKHKNGLKDIKFYHEQYNEDVALAAFKRLEKIWKWVQKGKLNDLPSSGADCYRCSRVLYRT